MKLRRWSRNWLLWLALLLPLAQAMAGAHAVSHLSDRQGDAVAHLVHCDLCLSAASLGAGAPPATPVVLPAPAARHVLVAVPAAPCAQTRSAWLPPARAPPLSA